MRSHWIVFGGELKTLTPPPTTPPRLGEFKDPALLEFVGAFPDEDAAKAAWKGRAQATVDNAHMRFFVMHVSADMCERITRPGSVNQKLQAFLRMAAERVPFDLNPLDF